MNVGIVCLCVLLLSILLASALSRRFVWGHRIVLILIACIAAEETGLSWYDRYAISNAHSKRAGANYAVFTGDGSFFLEQPNSLSPQGFRSIRVEPKVAHGRRILLLGDSFVVGTGSSPAANYAQVLESKLRTRFPGEDLSIFSAGVNGAGLQEQHSLFAYLLDQGYTFDAVVLHFYLGGDQVNNVRGTTRIVIDGRPARLHTNLLLRFFYPLNFTAFRFLISQNATQRASEWHAGAVLPQTSGGCVAAPSFEAYMAEMARFSYAAGAPQRVDMPYVLDLLHDLVEEARRHNLPLALVLLPDKNIELAAQQRTGIPQPMDYDWIRRAVTAGTGGAYPSLDLTGAFRNRADLFQCNGIHWNDAGNVYAGEIVAQFLAANPGVH